MKLTKEDREEIYNLHINNEKCENIALKFNVAKATINRSIQKKNKLLNIKNRHRAFKKPTNNLIGTFFGKLEVIELVQPKNKRDPWKFKCKCHECKSEKLILTAYGLKNRLNKTCGCIKIEMRKGKNSTSFKGYEDISGSFWHIVMRNARLRNIDVTITIEDAWNLFLSQNKKCALSGIDITFGESNYDETTASLDRIDSNKGYDIDNIQWVHKTLNFMKNNLTDEKFIYYCQKVVEYRENKNN